MLTSLDSACRCASQGGPQQRAAADAATGLLLADACVLGLLSPGALPEPDVPVHILQPGWGRSFLQTVQAGTEQEHTCLRTHQGHSMSEADLGASLLEAARGRFDEWHCLPALWQVKLAATAGRAAVFI